MEAMPVVVVLVIKVKIIQAIESLVAKVAMVVAEMEIILMALMRKTTAQAIKL
ncbi:hypothetical protein [Campylobacter lari]|uniref:hypothetical protein n=1 Tax=Campylobacter lari TaxID=201 RepID=UPI0015F24C93|nr:hypothetical protein [Campylobacter lari]